MKKFASRPRTPSTDTVKEARQRAATASEHFYFGTCIMRSYDST